MALYLHRPSMAQGAYITTLAKGRARAEAIPLVMRSRLPRLAAMGNVNESSGPNVN